jgi:toxin ParE1/3/4
VRLSIHDLVKRDISEALSYYEDRSMQAAARFALQLEQTLAELSKHPGQHTPYLGSAIFRRARLKDFPYLIIYRLRGDAIRVTVLKHEKRHPAFGMRRV